MRIGSLGLPELLIILLVVLLIFGPRRLPDMAKGLGQSVREFRKGIKDMKEDFEAETGGQDGKQDAKGQEGKARAAGSAAAGEAAEAAPRASSAPQATPAATGPAAGDGTPEDHAPETKEA